MKHLWPILLLALSSCIPEERIWWSPDGKHAAVIAGAQIVITDNNGTVIGKVEAQSDTVPLSASWLADSSAILCVKKRKLHHWNDVRGLIPADEATTIDQLMPSLMTVLNAVAQASETTKKLEDILAAVPEYTRSILVNAVMRSFETSPDQTLQALGKHDSLLRNLKVEYEVHDLCLVSLTALDQPKILSSSLLNAAFAPRASPTSPFFACIRMDQEGDRAALEVHSILHPDQTLVVSAKASIAFDWTADGRALVFMSSMSDDNGPIYSIQHAEVVSEDGKLLASDALKVKTLATALCPDHQRIATLPDGRILFATQTVQLPALHVDGPVDSQLYLLTPQSAELTLLPTAPGALPAFPGHFALSPDGKKLAIVESDLDAVAVVDIASGQTQIISEPHDKWKCRTLPAWRSSTELTFASVHDGRPQWMSWSESTGIKPLSAQWPEAMTKEWLEKAEPPKAQP